LPDASLTCLQKCIIMNDKKRVLSGFRPSGKLHLGHLFGALSNWLKLQEVHRCFYFVADWHALTTEYKNTTLIEENTLDMVADWLAVGLDPGKSVIFVQSAIIEHAELNLLFSMFTRIARLERVPSFKDVQQETGRQDLDTIGFLSYPLLQSADILMYNAHYVPVGVDQLPHIELTRETARKFNELYGEVFIEPEGLLTEAPKVPGTDGRKMSKSYGNAIFLSDPPEAVEAKLLPMKTDVRRQRRSDPGVPEDCPVFDLQKIFSSDDTVKWVHEGCKTAGIGCIECKRALIPKINEVLAPIRERRATFDYEKVRQVLREGNKSALEFSRGAMRRVREAMKFQVKL